MICKCTYGVHALSPRNGQPATSQILVPACSRQRRFLNSSVSSLDVPGKNV